MRKVHLRHVIATRFPWLRERWRRCRGVLRASVSRSTASGRPTDVSERGLPAVGPASSPADVRDVSRIVATFRVGGARVPSLRAFRVLFVVRPGVADAACMRYRAFNLIEALRLEGIEAAHLDDRRIPEQLPHALGFDLIVLVRRRMSAEIALLLDAAQRCRVPVLADLDDDLFHEESIPYIEMYRVLPIDEARRSIATWRDVILACDAFTTTTPHLAARAAGLGRRCYLIRNGLNSAQVELSRNALEGALRDARGEGVRLGYFSGTRTHQEDFRLIADVLARILDEFPPVSLTVAGDFDLEEFPQFGRFGGRIETRPFVDWRLLPAEIARVDVNLIPLQRNPFTEGKSNLKYYEAGLLRIPSVATPTGPFASTIRHGVNGLLAGDPGEWYESLRSLIVAPDLRRGLGERAYEHVMESYAPEVVASEALAAYRDVLARHRRRLGVADDAATVVIVLSDLARAVRDRSSAVALGVGLVRAGAHVTLLLPEGPDRLTADEGHRLLAEHMPDPAGLPAIQVGDNIPCCDLLIATDPATAQRVRPFEHRARKAAYLLHGVIVGGDQAAVRSGDEIVGKWGTGRLFFVPPWVSRPPVAPDVTHRPGSLLVAAEPGCLSWDRGAAARALRRVRAAYPDLRLVLCGDAADLRIPDLPHDRLPGLSGEGFERILAERPLCLVLASRGRPAWVHDLMAAGCPVICAPNFVDPRDRDAETTEGLVMVPARAGDIADAVDSLLCDPVRLAALAQRSAAHVRGMTDAAGAARVLLQILDGTDRDDAGPRDEPVIRGALGVLSLAS